MRAAAIHPDLRLLLRPQILTPFGWCHTKADLDCLSALALCLLAAWWLCYGACCGAAWWPAWAGVCAACQLAAAMLAHAVCFELSA